jgi:hypothetical protein
MVVVFERIDLDFAMDALQELWGNLVVLIEAEKHRPAVKRTSSMSPSEEVGAASNRVKP